MLFLAHFMHINEFYVVYFKDLELSHSGGRVLWKHIQMGSDFSGLKEVLLCGNCSSMWLIFCQK